MTQVTSDGRTCPSGPVAFSTVGLPEEQRIELWESHNADALIGLRCHTLTAAVLEATEINVQLERVHLARVRGSSHVVERDLTMVRKRPAESVALFFSLAGEAFFYHDDGVRTVQPGQMLMCDADRPFMRGFSQGLEELVLKIPRDVFADVTGIDGIRRPVVVNFAAGTNSFAHTLARQVGRAARDLDSDPPTSRRSWSSWPPLPAATRTPTWRGLIAPRRTRTSTSTCSIRRSRRRRWRPRSASARGTCPASSPRPAPVFRSSS